MIEEDKIYFARTPYGQEEIDATVKCLEEGWVGPGKYTDEFESKVSSTLGKKYGVMVNSGSSALLLVSAILDIKKQTLIFFIILVRGDEKKHLKI